MDIRQAILKAADSIERDGSQYQFMAWDVNPCGTPMCMLGWIGHHLGMNLGTNNWSVGEAIGLSSTNELYNFVGASNCFDAATAAEGLRRFADAKFPAESRALIPESVARIFRMSHAELAGELESA